MLCDCVNLSNDIMETYRPDINAASHCLKITHVFYIDYNIFNIGVRIAESVWLLATGWTSEWSETESR
jgi:hypothetical protein